MKNSFPKICFVVFITFFSAGISFHLSGIEEKRAQKYELFIASHRSRQQVFMWTDNGQVIEMTGSTCLPRRGWWKCVSRHALIGVCGPFSCSQKNIDLQWFFFSVGKLLHGEMWDCIFRKLNCQQHNGCWPLVDWTGIGRPVKSTHLKGRECGIFGTCLLFQWPLNWAGFLASNLKWFLNHYNRNWSFPEMVKGDICHILIW